jgi:hypothetical protein
MITKLQWVNKVDKLDTCSEKKEICDGNCTNCDGCDEDSEDMSIIFKGDILIELLVD